MLIKALKFACDIFYKKNKKTKNFKRIKRIKVWKKRDWVTNYNGSGVNGILFTSKSDTSKKLFLPASGCVSNFFSESAGKVCYYWSSSIYNNNDCYGFILNIRSALIFVALSNRNDGNTVRGVFNTFWMK